MLHWSILTAAHQRGLAQRSLFGITDGTRLGEAVGSPGKEDSCSAAVGERNPTLFLAGFPSVSLISFPPAPERWPRRGRKQLGPGLPGTILGPAGALEGAGRKQHNGPGLEEGSVQEGTPPSFPSPPCLGTFSSHPCPWMAATPEEGDVNLLLLISLCSRC